MLRYTQNGQKSVGETSRTLRNLQNVFSFHGRLKGAENQPCVQVTKNSGQFGEHSNPN